MLVFQNKSFSSISSRTAGNNSACSAHITILHNTLWLRFLQCNAKLWIRCIFSWTYSCKSVNNRRKIKGSLNKPFVHCNTLDTGVDDFCRDYLFVDWYKTTQDEGYSQYFSQRIGFWTWWLSLLKMLLHTNMLCKRRRDYEWLHQKWLDIHLLFLFKTHMNSGLKIPVANFCRLLTSQTHPGHGRFVASWNINCVWFACPTFPESNSKVQYFWNCAWNFYLQPTTTQCALKALKPSPWPIPIVLNTNMSSCRNECNKVNIGQYIETMMM